MFLKCSRLVSTSLISLSILFSVVSPAFAGKDDDKKLAHDDKKPARVLRSKSKLKTEPLETSLKTDKAIKAKENRAPVAAPRTGADSTDTSSSFDSDFRDPASRPEPKPAVSKPAAPKPAVSKPADPKPAVFKPVDLKPADFKPVAAAESRKRPLEEASLVPPPVQLTTGNLASIVTTTDLVTGRLWDFSPALHVVLGDAKSKAQHQAQIDKARLNLISTLLTYIEEQRPVLLDRFIRLTNGWDFLNLDNPHLFIQVGVKALSQITEVDSESVIRHANKLILTGLYDHTNVSDPLVLYKDKSIQNRSSVAYEVWPFLNVSTESPADNYEARLVVRLLRLTSTSEIQKIAQKLKDANLYILPEAPSHELKFVNKDPKDVERVFQIIFTHVKENIDLYGGPSADAIREIFDQIAREERARPRVADQSERSSQQL